MRLGKKNKENNKLNKIAEWILYMLGYIIVFILISILFDSIYIDINHFFLYATSIVLLIHILNKTVKPILVTLTIPITGITLGLFYPFINLFILKLADWIFQSHFELKNIYIALLAAILLSIMNFLMEEIIKKIVKRVKKYE